MLSGILGPVTVLQPVGEDQPAACGRWQPMASSTSAYPMRPTRSRCGAVWQISKRGAAASRRGSVLARIFKSGFSQESFTAQIRTDILKDVEKDAPAPDPLFLARLFLMMAEELDVKQTEIALELASSQSAEKDLFARMTGNRMMPAGTRTIS
ncbi:MAG: hypothetical protein R2875_06290 [Desulfobacterales bacterium]